MLRVYRQARLATMTIIGRTETVSDELPGDSHAAPEAVEITTAQKALGRLSPTGFWWGLARGGGGLLGTRLLKLSGNVLLWRVCYWGSYQPV